MPSPTDHARRLLTLLLEERGVAAPDGGDAEELLRRALAVDEPPGPVQAAFAKIIDAAVYDQDSATGQRTFSP